MFDGETSMDDLQEMLKEPVDTVTTEITESYSFADYCEDHPDRIVLFSTTTDNRIRFLPGKAGNEVSAGDKVTAVTRRAPDN